MTTPAICLCSALKKKIQIFGSKEQNVLNDKLPNKVLVFLV